MKNINLLILTFCGLILSGCATFDYQKPSPVQPEPIAVSITDDKYDSAWDVPLGIYEVPDTSIIISGHQKGDGTGGFFGVLGILAGSSSDAAQGKEKVAQAALDNLPLKRITETAFETAISSSPLKSRFSFGVKTDVAQLKIASALLLNYISDEDILPFVVLKAELIDSKGGKLWSMRVFASGDRAMPLVGDVSWTANNAQPLNEVVSRGLKKAAYYLLTDMADPYPRKEQQKVLVETNVPFVKNKVRMVGYRLTENSDTLVFVPSAADANVFAGMNIFAKSLLSVRPAQSSDPITVILE